MDSFRITHILDISTAANNRSLSESETLSNVSMTSPRIQIVPPTPSYRRTNDDSFGSAGSLPRPESRSHIDAWKQLNEELNLIFPKRYCSHDPRRASFIATTALSHGVNDDDDHHNPNNVYHTIHGGKNNPLTASRTVGPFAKLFRRRISTSPGDGILQVNEKNSSTSTSLTSLNILTPTIEPGPFYFFAPAAVR